MYRSGFSTRVPQHRHYHHCHYNWVKLPQSCIDRPVRPTAGSCALLGLPLLTRNKAAKGRWNCLMCLCFWEEPRRRQVRLWRAETRARAPCLLSVYQIILMQAGASALAPACPGLAPQEAHRVVPPGCNGSSSTLVKSHQHKLNQHNSGFQPGCCQIKKRMKACPESKRVENHWPIANGYSWMEVDTRVFLP